MRYTMMTTGFSKTMKLIIAAVILSAAMMIGFTISSLNSANALVMSKKSSTNCEGTHCQTTACINNKCHTLFSTLNSTKQLFNSTIP